MENKYKMQWGIKAGIEATRYKVESQRPKAKRYLICIPFDL
jgi:hypothetical protein